MSKEKKMPKPKKQLDMPKKLKKLAGRHILFDDVLAQAWIDHDLKVREKVKMDNRPITKPNVKAKAEDMLNDAYMTTSQGPTVDRNTAVIDGQHQLRAVVMYYEMARAEDIKPTPIELFVKEGEDPDNFPFYDLGKVRSGADVFSIEKMPYPLDYAVATRLLWIRVNGKLVAGAGRFSPYSMLEFVKDYKGLKKSLDFITKFGTEEDSLPCKETMTVGYASALHFLMSNADLDEGKDVKKLANEFWTQVIEREAKSGTAVHKLSKKLQKAKADNEFKLSRDALVHNCVQAFIMWTEKDTGALKINNGDYPMLGGIDCKNCPEEEEE